MGRVRVPQLASKQCLSTRGARIKIGLARLIAAFLLGVFA